MRRKSPHGINSMPRATNPWNSIGLATLLLGVSLVSTPLLGQEASESSTGSGAQESQAAGVSSTSAANPVNPDPVAQETPDETETQNNAERLAAAFQATQKDLSAESLDRVIETCESVLSGEPNPDDQAYAVQLAVWGLTQRSGLRM